MKIENIIKNITKNKELMWPFKWYILFDVFFLALLCVEYINPPQKDDKIWNSEAVKELWNYLNQDVYSQSLKQSIIISVLFFLLAMSNMRHHPIIAKILFLFPLYAGWCGLLS